MIFTNPLIEGIILNRYKRFLCDIKLPSGEVVVAHLANTGSMRTCWEPGFKALLSYHSNPNRKLKYSLEMLHNGETWIGVNTSLTNKLVIEAIQNGTITELQNYPLLKPEHKVGMSRLDLYLERNTEKCFVEIKNVTLLGDHKTALFPDAVTSRGQKHLLELIKLKKLGHRSVMVYVIQREDCDQFSPAKEIDPVYASLLSEAIKAGVEILIYRCTLTPKMIQISQKTLLTL